jgi:hypothetical protein
MLTLSNGIPTVQAQHIQLSSGLGATCGRGGQWTIGGTTNHWVSWGIRQTLATRLTVSASHAFVPEGMPILMLLQINKNCGGHQRNAIPSPKFWALRVAFQTLHVGHILKHHAGRMQDVPTCGLPLPSPSLCRG